jgi:hypothetical protein
VPDGTIIGTFFDNATERVMRVSPADPSAPTEIVAGVVSSASSDGSRVLIATEDGPTIVYDVSTASMTTLSAPSAPSIAYFSEGISADGRHAFLLAAWASPCSDTSATATLTDLDTTQVATMTFDCGATQLQPVSDYSAIVYVENSALYATNGMAPMALTSSGERVAMFWLEPGTNRVVVQALDAQNAWHLFSIRADGTDRAELGDALPLDRTITQVQFNSGVAYVTADALTQGIVELFRFALP